MKMFASVKSWQLHVRTTTIRMQSRQFHSQSLVNGPFSIFARENTAKENTAETWRLSPEEFPAVTGHWHSRFGNSGTFRIGDEDSHDILSKCICLCLQTLLAISWTYGKAIFPAEYLLTFKSTQIFALREFETFWQPNEVISFLHCDNNMSERCRIVCCTLRYVDLSSLTVYDIP